MSKLLSTIQETVEDGFKVEFLMVPLGDLRVSLEKQHKRYDRSFMKQNQIPMGDDLYEYTISEFIKKAADTITKELRANHKESNKNQKDEADTI